MFLRSRSIESRILPSDTSTTFSQDWQRFKEDSPMSDLSDSSDSTEWASMSGASSSASLSSLGSDQNVEESVCFRLKPKHENRDSGFGSKYESIERRTPSATPTPPPATDSFNLYPNCDATVWLRSCEHEIVEPISGTIKGTIPQWIKGSLLRNGPGSLKVGDMQFKHLFDSSALVHRFGISDGEVTYQCRFLQTDTYKKNRAANRIVVTQFGTTAVPDPCHSIFQRVSAMFRPGDMSDNAMISIYPFGDEYFAFTEFPVIHSINVESLETVRRLDVADYIGIMSHSSHPHVMADGTVYNLGMTVTKQGPCYNIICFPKGDAMFEDSHIVASVPSRWKFYPGYMHTFAITEHYFVIVEQPLSVSVPEMLRSQLLSKPLASNFKWFADQNTCIYLLCRNTGKLKHTYEADAFFYLHIINAYETSDYVVVDICCYKDPAMLDCMYTEAMRNMQSNPDYARMFRAKPLRFVLPLRYNISKKPAKDSLMLRSLSFTNLMAKWSAAKPKMIRSFSEQQSIKYRAIESSTASVEDDATYMGVELSTEVDNENLVLLENSEAKAFVRNGLRVFCKPEVLCDLGCETPRIFYELYMGKRYRYFYAISSDVDAENPGTLIKVDVDKKTRSTWCEINCYPSEPIFVPNPYSTAEDDGIVLAAMVWGGEKDENRVGLLVLCAKTWTEIGRCEFETPGPVPKCLHGWFSAASD